MDASRQLAADLGCLPGDPLLHVERLRLVDGEPLVLETSHLPLALFPGLERADLARRSLYDVLLEDHGRAVARARETIEPVILTPSECALLDVPRHTPAILTRRLTTDRTGVIVELGQALLRGDRSRYLLIREVHDPDAGLQEARAGSSGSPDMARAAGGIRLDAETVAGQLGPTHPTSHRERHPNRRTIRRMTAADRWLDAARLVLDAVATTQGDRIEAASRIFADSIAADRLVHVFGSGHSRMNTEEMFPRIGSYPGFHPARSWPSPTTWASSAPTASARRCTSRRSRGFARIILEQVKIHPGDSFLIFSSTGINGVVIELALLAKRHGPAGGRGDLARPRSRDRSRHPSGKKLADIADVTIDNCSPAGDASVDIAGVPYKVGPTSSIGAIAVVNSLKARTAELLAERGVTPVVLTSPHFTGSDEGERQLERVYDEYFRRVRQVYDADGAIPVPVRSGERPVSSGDTITVRAPRMADADVVVVGAGSAGSSAAIAAARTGASVLLIDKLPFLGGTSTAVLDTFYGFFTPGSRSLKVVGGIADEVVTGLERLGPVVHRPNTYGAGTGVTYHPEHLKVVWERLATDAGVRILLHALAPGRRRRATAASRSWSWRRKPGWPGQGVGRSSTPRGDADLCAFAGFGFEQAGGDRPRPDPDHDLPDGQRRSGRGGAPSPGTELHRLMAEAAARAAYDLPRREGSDHVTPVPGMTATIMTRLHRPAATTRASSTPPTRGSCPGPRWRVVARRWSTFASSWTGCRATSTRPSRASAPRSASARRGGCSATTA